MLPHRHDTPVMKCCESTSSNLATAGQMIAWQLEMEETHRQNLNPFLSSQQAPQKYRFIC